MKCLTICQPYAHLIMLPDDHDRAKRVENRKWYTSYRGQLLIHAGKSREWLDLDEDELIDESYNIPLAEMAFGAIVGVCRLSDCRSISDIRAGRCGNYPWLAGHEHTEGPWCWVLTECRRFQNPIPYRGAQGLFDVPEIVLDGQLPWRAK